MKTIGRGQCEFDNFESTVNAGLHGLGTCFRCWRAQDGTGTNVGEGLEDAFVVLGRFGPIERRRIDGGRRGKVVPAGNAVGSAEESVGGKTKSHFVLDRIITAD